MSIPLENVSSKKGKKETIVVSESSDQIKYSNSSYIVVQDEMLISEMTDRINEIDTIYEKPSENEISVELFQGKHLAPIAEETSTLIGDEKCLKKKPTGHSFEMVRSNKNCQTANIVSLYQLT